MKRSGCDPFELAFRDYLEGETGNYLMVNNNKGDDEEWPVAYFFRTYEDMPELEKIALKCCSGKVLDVGAGAGCHSLVLQANGVDVTAMDNKAGLVEVIKQRGVQQVIRGDILNFRDDRFDTLLFLMNGTGIFGTLESFSEFLASARQLLLPGGQILIDSSDLMYLYEEEDGSVLINLNESYYGEVIYRVGYRDCFSEPFPWLFIDQSTLEQLASEAGFRVEVLYEGDHFEYLAKIF